MCEIERQDEQEEETKMMAMPWKQQILVRSGIIVKEINIGGGTRLCTLQCCVLKTCRIDVEIQSREYISCLVPP